ncbi:MAG: DUF177 domain-containing protein [Elusimicrobiaceae bacterium]|nr:DUF177 domain-containing protein [Elusimicrobiaceae bacterium]
MRNVDHYQLPEDLRFRTDDLLALGGMKCTVRLKPDDLAGTVFEPGSVESATLKLDISVGGADFLAWGRIKGRKTLACSRCLKEFSCKFSEEFEETFSRESKIIDIMETVRQTLVLANDICPVCDDKCKGLCAVCGTNLNEKECGCKPERLSPFALLKDLKKSDSK